MIFKRLTDTPMADRGLWWRLKMLSAIALCFTMAAALLLIGWARRGWTGAPP